jgi:hypothetical protein
MSGDAGDGPVRYWLVGIVDFCCALNAFERYDKGQVLPGTIWLVIGIVFSAIGFNWPRIRLGAKGLVDWSRLGRRITATLWAMLVLAAVWAVFAGYSAWRSFSRVASREEVVKPQETVAPSNTPTPPPSHTKVGRVIKPVSKPIESSIPKPIGSMDWHDKQNW